MEIMLTSWSALLITPYALYSGDLNASSSKGVVKSLVGSPSFRALLQGLKKPEYQNL